MQHPLAEQRKASLSIALSFDQLQLGHMPFHMPLLIHQVSPALTASLSFSTPAAKDCSSGILLNDA
jgi:hypothetical protein